MLPQVAVGDPILIRDQAAGFTYVYFVQEAVALSVDDPAGLRYLHASPRAQLTLITCEGSFDRAVSEYSDRRIVVAELTATIESLELGPPLDPSPLAD